MTTEKPIERSPALEASDGSEAFPRPDRPLTHDDVHAVLNDPEIEPDDRQARLEAMARYAAAERGDEPGEPSLLEMQIREALALLAEGGHTYGTVDALGFDDEADAGDVEDGDPEQRA
ncbi:hypothetical protein [Consotaella salsifontis]|uniref:Uncharacterized protein n=1 Tax=Consotaella salsifontis TaxID=1365950 RepID=A0A1T4NU81_9HYPH|nr:hypothetical protein [Consotaella salsifontis]SJZ82642.1 hypothetical protein SAMN05428963_103185 [Consotaella salsifontis]